MQPAVMKPKEIVAAATKILHQFASDLTEGTDVTAAVVSERTRRAAGNRTYTVTFTQGDGPVDLNALSHKLGDAIRRQNVKGKLVYGDGQVEVAMRNEPSTLNILRSAHYEATLAANEADLQAALETTRARTVLFFQICWVKD